MLAMTTSPSENNLAHVTLVRQQRELERQKRAAERSMPDHRDKPTPLFNPPVKKEYNDETATRMKSIFGEPATIAHPTVRHTGGSQQDRRRLPKQSLPQLCETNMPVKRAESPVATTATVRLGDSVSLQATTATRSAVGHTSGVSDGKGMSSTILPAPPAASSSSPCGQGSNPPLLDQATTFPSIVRPLSTCHEQISAGLCTDSTAALKVQSHVVAKGNSSSAVQDGSSPVHGGVFHKPLPRLEVNGLLNGMKPSIPKLVISDELVDHDVSSILQEMRSLTPLSGINTPRKEMPMLRFPVPGDTEGVVQVESSIMDVGPKTKTSDNDVLDDLITSDTEESDTSDEESHSRSDHSFSDTDDTSQSHDSDSDDDGNDRGNTELVVIPHDLSSRPPEVFPSFNNASHGAHSGDSWSLEALEQGSRSKVETPPLELPGPPCSSTRGKQMPSDRQVTGSRSLKECEPPILGGLNSPLPLSHLPNDNAHSSVDVASANQLSICAESMEDVGESSMCHNDSSEGGSANHVAGQYVFTGNHLPSKIPLSPDDSNDMDDEDITVDIESVSPPSIEKAGPRLDTAQNNTRSSSAAGDPASSDKRETQSTSDLMTAIHSQPNFHPNVPDSYNCKEWEDIVDTGKHEVSISTSTVTTTSEIELGLTGSPAHMLTLSQLEAENTQPLIGELPEHTGTLSPVARTSSPPQASNDEVLTVVSLEAKPVLSLTISMNDQPSTTVIPSLAVQIPLHLINKLPMQPVPPPKHAHPPSCAPILSKNRGRCSSSTSSPSNNDEDSRNIAEHDEIVQPTSTAAAVNDKLDRPKSGGNTDRVSYKAARSGHSSKRKNVVEQDIEVTQKKSRSSEKDDAKLEVTSSNSTKDKKGPAKTVASVPTPSSSDRRSDTGSANKKYRTGEQPALADSEADIAHGSAKSGSSSSSSRHGDLAARAPAPPLAPPSIPNKSAGPSYTNGLPPRASPLLSSDIDGLPEYCRRPDIYLPEAKRLKHKADLCSDMQQKYLTYLESIHMFLLCARAIERDSPTNITQIYKMYLETYRLLSHIHKHKHSKAVDTGVWVILSLWTQSLLCQKLYKLTRPDCEKHHKAIEQFFKEPIKSSIAIAQPSVSSLGHVKNHGSPASPAPSPSGSVASTSSLTSDSGNGTSGKTGVACTPPRQPTSNTSGATNSLAAGGASALPGIVPVPIKTYTSMKGYAQTVRLLELCHQYWDQADMLVLEEIHRAFFTHVEEHVPPLTLHSSIIHLAHYLKVAVESLRKMPEPASSAGRYS